PLTVAQFETAIKGSKTILWNGPMGVFEKAPFAAGTVGVARAVAGSGAFSVIGGGDTIAAVQLAGVSDRIGYISTAGGALLGVLQGRTPPRGAALPRVAPFPTRRRGPPPPWGRTRNDAGGVAGASAPRLGIQGG